MGRLEPAQVSVLNEYTIGQTYDVPLSKVKINPFNARQVVAMSSLETLSTSIVIKQNTAATGYIDKHGNVCLIDGHRRFEAARLGNKKTIRIEIQDQPLNDKELYKSSRSANTEREGQSPLDDALAWKILIEKGVYENQTEIAKDLGIDEAEASRIYKLLEIPSSITRLIAERPNLHTLRMLDAIRKFYAASNEIDTEELLIEISKNDLSSREVDRRRDAISKPKSTRVRAITSPMKFQHGSSNLKRFDDKLVLEVTDVVDPQVLEKLTKSINELVKQTLS